MEVGAGGELGGDQGFYEGPQDRTGTQGSDCLGKLPEE